MLAISVQTISYSDLSPSPETSQELDHSTNRSDGLPASNTGSNKVASTADSDQTDFFYNGNTTQVYLNTSHVQPGEVLGLTVNSTEWSMDNHNNTYRYQIASPTAQRPVNSSMINPTNNSVGTASEVSSWEGQNLTSTYQHNLTSYYVYPTDLTLTKIEDVANSTQGFTTAKVEWKTAGKANSSVVYGTAVDSLTETESSAIYTTTHVIYLTNLFPNTTYYYNITSVDIFGNSLTNGTFSVTTPEVTEGYAYIQNVTISGVGVNTATVDFDTSLPANGSLVYSKSRNTLLTGGTVEFTGDTTIGHTVGLGPLDQGTTYFFYLNVSIGDNETVENNAGIYFQFTTTTDGVVAPDLSTAVSVQANYNSTHAKVEFNTTANIYNISTIVSYATTPYFTSPKSTTRLVNTTTHVHYIPILQATHYYFRIILDNNAAGSGAQQWVINDQSSYYQFETQPRKTVLTNEGLVELGIEIPTYPAVLGVWQFTLTVQLNETDDDLTNTTKTYVATFIVNNTLSFNLQTTLVQRGTWANDTDMYNNWVRDDAMDESSIYSPGDHVGFVGNLLYQNSGVDINRSNIEYWGQVRLYYEGEKIGSDGIIIDLPPSSLGINQSHITNIDTNLSSLFEFTLPDIDLFGQVTVEFRVLFPSETSYGGSGYTQVTEMFNITVKYRLAVTERTGEADYSLTDTNVHGSATILPYHWHDLSAFTDNNVSNVLEIPGDQVQVDVIVQLGATNVELFQVEKANYTYYWYRDRLESSVATGSYALTLNWTAGRINVALAENVYGSANPTAFTYNFTVDKILSIKDLTGKNVVNPGTTAIVRFKVVVNGTQVAWDQQVAGLTATPDSGITLAGTIEYKEVTGEYQLQITVGESTSSGNYTINISGGGVLDGDLTVVVMEEPTETTEDTALTETTTEKPISLTDWGLMGLTGLGAVVYIGVVVVFFRRK